MRVGLMIYGDPASRSGGYLYDRKLVEYLRQQGDSVEVISLTRRPYALALLDRPDIDRLLKARPEVLLQDELIHASLFRFNRRLAGALGCPVAGLVHLFTACSGRPAAINWFYRLIESAYLRTLDGLILNSRSTLGQARAMLDGQLPPHVVAVPGSDHLAGSDPGSEAAAEPGGIPAGGPLRLLFVGNLIRQKGLHVLLDALAGLPRGDFLLTVAGGSDLEPGYATAVRRRIRRHGLQGQVELRGPVDQADLPGLYRGHQLFVMPSVNEAYGIVYLEAQRFGLPAIGTTAGGAGEIIEHGVNGCLVPPGDSRALAGLLLDLSRDRTRLQQLGLQALETSRRHPTWGDTGATVRRFLLQLAGREGSLA